MPSLNISHIKLFIRIFFEYMFIALLVGMLLVFTPEMFGYGFIPSVKVVALLFGFCVTLYFRYQVAMRFFTTSKKYWFEYGVSVGVFSLSIVFQWFTPFAIGIIFWTLQKQCKDCISYTRV